MPIQVNTQFGQYRIVRLLGRGGMGEVYEVEHTVLKRRYALKLLPPDFASRPEAIQRFEQEARVMANLEHPHIIKVDDFGKTKDRYWLRMELAKGLESGAVTLEEFAATGGGRIRQIEYAGILCQLLEALAYAHEQGVVHRDLKPGNVLLGTDAAGYLTVKISDFGLARLIGEHVIQSQAQQSVSLGEAPTLGRDEGAAATKAGPEKSTSSRSLLGTWEYMSPEQRRGETADARSDVYSLGLMSFRLLTGKGLGMKLPSEAEPELHQEWDAFIARACEQEPQARYANGRKMFEASAGVMAVMIQAKEALKAAVTRQAEEARQQQEAEAKTEGLVSGAMGKARVRRWVSACGVLMAGCLRAIQRRWGWVLGVGSVVLLGVAGSYWGSARAPQSARKGAASQAVSSSLTTTKERPWTNGLGVAGKVISSNILATPKNGSFTNSLGMPFVPVPNTHTLFCVWLTRVQDYTLFVTAKDLKWPKPPWKQSPTQPAVHMTWVEAKAFCDWLTEKERGERRLVASARYRLPTDLEWSAAVGLPAEKGQTPRDRDGKIAGVYPWGTNWPPPTGAGNYMPSLRVDRFKDTSPVGSFPMNPYGLFDMGGNVWEWCEDEFEPAAGSHVVRGGSCYASKSSVMLSSCRLGFGAGYHYFHTGFRIVLAFDVETK